MTTEAFENFVKKRLNEAKNNQLSKDIDWNKERDDWLQSLNDLYSKIRRYLKKYLEADQIQVEREKIVISEEFLGSYEVDKLTIRIGDEKIVAKPIGRNLIGASGRVDLIGVRGRLRLVLFEKEEPPIPIRTEFGEKVEEKTSQSPSPNRNTSEEGWHIATFPPHITTTPLSADTFRDALVELSDV